LLEVTDVDVYYGEVKVLTDISLKMERGEVVGIIGRNGAGKTTLLKTIAGFLRPAKGSIKFFGKDITRLPSHETARLGIRYVRQDKKVFTKLTVKENLELAAYATGDWDLDRVLNIFPRLKRLLNNKAGGLSGGERQMLLIAQALLGKPALLLMDEPTEGLAALVITELTNVLEMLKNEGQSMIIVEQNLPVATRISDRIYVLKEGRITKEITKKEMTSMPYELYEKFL
jgi:ABC-type branched-subunit amino acid transport system ATPase component